MLLTNILLLIISLCNVSNALHRMYETKRTAVDTTFDCLYDVTVLDDVNMNHMEYVSSGSSQIVWYCRRLTTTTSNQDLIVDDNHGLSGRKILSFDRLREMGISASQLFKWNAPIDVVEDYISGQKIGSFVNCSDRGSLWFGTYCEYTFDSSDNLLKLINERFRAKKQVPENILSITNGTCYELNGVECISVICLDWQEICDGKIDCANGFDEQHCHELEENECNPITEYRCRNGQCIDKAFYLNEQVDCMDYSDEMHVYSKQCYSDYESICEDKLCPPFSFSCGDGFCYDGPNMINSSCKSQRDRLYFNQMSQSKLTLFSHITLIYNNMTSISICFNKTLCPHLSNHRTTFVMHGLTCRSLNTFTNKTYNHFDDMLKDVRRFVRSCASLSWKSKFSNHSKLFQCDDKITFISKSRLSDGYDDCSNGEDEHPEIACSLNLPYRFKCDKETRCIPISLAANGIRNCDDGSDEGWMRNVCFDELSDECRLYRNEPIRFNLTFIKLCDGIVEQLPDMNNDTDETDCKMTEWPCNLTSSRCNSVWNCPNGSDELNCHILTIFSKYCNYSKHFCLDIHTGHPICLPVEQSGNDIIDCLGSSDERTFCRNKYPYEHVRRYRCQNSNICITPVQICDCHQDCPENDDETIACIWLNNGQQHFCHHRQFRCRNGQYLNEETQRCDDDDNCADGEDELFCDLIDRRHHTRLVITDIPKYPVMARNTLTYSNFIVWHCNYGIYVRSAIDPPGFYCLCPNEYYGDRCQFQRKRISIILLLRTASLLDDHLSIFKFVIMLVRDTTPPTIISHEEIVYTPVRYCLPTYTVTLLYPVNQSTLLSNNHSVYIHVFLAQTLTHRESWRFPVSFDFLPVNRIVKELIIPAITSISEANQFILNNTNCTSCSNVSLCLGYDTDLHRDICVCPSNRTGSRCLIPFNPCSEHVCYGNGECIPYEPRSSTGKQYICICHPEWFGIQCEQRKARIHVSFAKEIIFPSFSIALIHLIEMNYKWEPRQLIYSNRFNEQKSNFTVLINNRNFIPQLALIQLYEHTKKFDHYLLIVHPIMQSALTEIHTEIHPSRRCRSIEELFNNTILNQPRLRRVKNYQRPCLERQHSNNQLLCFYDDKMMCLCDKTNHANCFNFEPTYHGCLLNKCSDRGQCIQNNEYCPTNSTCICEQCSYGTACQFSTDGYTLSLDAILGSHIQTNTLNIVNQPTIIKVSVVLISLLVAIGIILNSFSISTFVQQSTRTSGSSLYLFVTSIIGLMCMIMLMCKMIILLLGKHNDVSCSLIEFALKWFPTCCEWLNACVAIERMLAVKRETKFSNSASRRAARYVAPSVVIFIGLTCTFELIFRRVIIDTYDKKAWCVLTLNHDRPILLTLYSIFNILLYLVPLIINLISCIIIIIGTFRLKQKIISNTNSAMSKHNQRKQKWKSMKKHIKKYKHILITTILLGLLAVPRLIITFIYVCTKLDRHPVLVLIGYLVGFLPSISVLFAFILPAKNYREAFTHSVKRIIPQRIQNSIARRRYKS